LVALSRFPYSWMDSLQTISARLLFLGQTLYLSYSHIFHPEGRDE